MDKYILILRFPVILPDGYFTMFWDTFIVFTILVNIFYLPMKISFELGEMQDYAFLDFLFEVIPSITFTLEILINFNTAFYREGIIHTSRLSIVQNYLNGDFLQDMVVIVPFFVSLQYDINYLQFLLLIRVTRLGRMVRNMEEVLNLRERFAAGCDLLKLILLILFVSHFCACAWYYVGQLEIQYNMHSWIKHYGLAGETKGTLYINCLYWSTITILTVGYGDISPQTNYEKIFCIIMTLITIGVFGYAINNIGQIFREMEEKSQKYNKKVTKLNFSLKKFILN